ncbi:hypothetical protein [Ensifer sp. MJa1]|uniref:hypothetical protein n=1 Tax=Ensifer sp. MJa1 TaxID=2919888 RepID=UPI00300AB2F5
MLEAARSTIRHVLTWAGETIRPTVSLEAFSEIQLRDIGLTRDEERIRARVADIAVPYNPPQFWKARPLQTQVQVNLPRPVIASPRASAGENKDISISLCD